MKVATLTRPPSVFITNNEHMTILTLDLTKVPIGLITIEGLVDPKTNEFYVGIPQIAEQFSIPIKHASRDIKAMMGAGFTFPQATTKLHSRLVNVVTLKNYELIVAKLDRKGNKIAQDFRDSLVGLSLTQLFCDAFKIKFDEEERQAYLVFRQESKNLFFELSTEITGWYETTKASRTQPKERYFTNSFDAINLALFGKKSKQIKSELGIGTNALCRDHFNNEALRRISQIQSIAAAAMRTKRIERPNDAIKFAIDCSSFDVVDYAKL